VSAPSGIVVDNSTNCIGSVSCIDVVDTLNGRVSKWTTGYSFSTTFGSFASSSGTSNFFNPSGITVDTTTNHYMYVVDTNNSRIVQWTNPASPTAPTYHARFGSYGTTAGTFHNPTGIAIDSESYCNYASGTACLWIADTGNNKIQSCSTNMQGGVTYCKIYGTGTYGSLLLADPTGIAVDSSNNVYVVDTGNNRVVAFTDTGAVYNAFASNSANYFGTAGYANGNFESPTGIAIDGSGSGNIWVTDSMNNRVEVFSNSGTWLFTIGGGGLCVSGTCTLNAYPTAASTISTPSTVNNCYSSGTFAGCAAGNNSSYFNNPTGIAYSAASGTSYIYVVDDNNSRVQVFNTSGVYQNQISGYGTCTPTSATNACFNF
jgi:hypothetical protein